MKTEAEEVCKRVNGRMEH